MIDLNKKISKNQIILLSFILLIGVLYLLIASLVKSYDGVCSGFETGFFSITMHGVIYDCGLFEYIIKEVEWRFFQSTPYLLVLGLTVVVIMQIKYIKEILSKKGSNNKQQPQ